MEPYAYKTGLTGVISLNNRQALKLSSLYNLTDMNNFIKTCCANTDLKSFEEFLNNASPHVVLVSFLTSNKQHQFSFLKNRNSVVLDCKSNVRSNVQSLNNWALNSLSEMFSCSRVVFLDARPKHKLPLRDIIDVLGSIVREQVTKFGSATVVLDTWKGLHSVPDTKYFSYIPGFTAKGCDDFHTIEHSNLVISAADRFVERFDLTQPAVGVHIRGERLLRNSNWNIEYSIDCLQLYNFLHNRSVDNYSFPKTVHVFHDMGGYGSTSCSSSKKCINGQRKLLLKIRQLRLPVISYDPSTFKSFQTVVFLHHLLKESICHMYRY